MALSTSTRVNARASCAVGVSVSPSTVIPDNCHTVVLLNRSAAQTIIVGQGAAGFPIPDDGTNLAIPPSATLTLNVGVLSERLTDLTDLIYDCDGATADCDLTYLCVSGRA